MSRYTILLIILIILLPCSCRRTNESKRSDFLRFEQLMPSNPDSVLSSLQTIDPEQLSRGEQAWYYLLKTEAEDKLYRDHTTDSLIAFARDYYASTGDIPRLAKAFYLSGRIHTDWKEWERATEEFLKAKELTEESEDWGLKGRIEEYLGYANWQNRLYKRAIPYQKQAYQYFLKAQDTVNMAYALKGLGTAYWLSEQRDSSICVLRQALVLAQKTTNGRLLSELYNRFGFIYKKKQQYDEAKLYFYQAIQSFPDEPYMSYIDLGALFLQTEQPDSSYIYLQYALSSDAGLSIHCLANYYLSEWANMVGKSDEAFDYRKQYELLSDSLKSQKATESIGEKQHKYDKNRLDKEHAESDAVNMFIIIAISLISSLAIAYLIKRIVGEQKKNLKSESRAKKLLNIIHGNEEQIALLQAKEVENTQKEAVIEQLKAENHEMLKKINAINIARCKAHPNLRRLYDKRTLCEPFTETMWAKFLENFESIYPAFESKLRKDFPTMPETLLRICTLSVMGVKAERIATILDLQSSTVSSHKQIIKKRYFAAERKAPLEDFLLKYVV